MKDITKQVLTILNDTPDLYEVFHADTFFVQNKINSYKTSLRFKSYPRFSFLQLPKAEKIQKELNSLLQKRNSSKNFIKRKISNNDLATILYTSLGIKKSNQPYSSKRFIPSAGGLYSVEAYILSLNTELSTGLYHYNIKHHALEFLTKSTKRDIYSLFAEPESKQSSFILCLTGKFENVVAKYKDRGYRYALIEAGHIGQNIALTATALNLLSTPIGGYYDELINKFLHLIPRKEAVIYAFAIG